MSPTLNDMQRNSSNNSYTNSQNMTNVSSIIQEIKQDVIGMDKHFNDYIKKIDDAARDYKKEITATMDKLTKMVN